MRSFSFAQQLYNCGNGVRAYFAAVQTGLDRNYQPMELLFAEIIERSLASS